jgi:RNA polymerase sigma-70 factor (ECF subfamily)
MLETVAEGAAAPLPARDCIRRRTAENASRLRTAMTGQFAFLVRSLRRFGYDIADAEDAVQDAFLVFARRLGDVEVGRERGFLFRVALKIASTHRRGLYREWRRCSAAGTQAEALPTPLEVSERNAARERLDQVLSALDLDLRTVLVLYELEEMPTAEIADLLGLPIGTVASRLRRAREAFRESLSRFQAKDAFEEGGV